MAISCGEIALYDAPNALYFSKNSYIAPLAAVGMHAEYFHRDGRHKRSTCQESA